MRKGVIWSLPNLPMAGGAGDAGERALETLSRRLIDVSRFSFPDRHDPVAQQRHALQFLPFPAAGITVIDVLRLFAIRRA
jgi:hypothetical protein